MRIGLYTKFFLEPTHVAIAQVLRGLSEFEYHVVAKGFAAHPSIDVPNASAVFDLTRGLCPPDVLADCDIIQAIYDGHIAFDAYQASLALKKPFILSFHGGFDTNAKIWKPRLRETTVSVAEAAAAVTVVSGTDADRLRQLGVKRHVDIVPVPIDISAAPGGLVASADRLITIGRLIPKKGIDIAIRCLAFLPPTFHLTIVGSGPEEATLRALAQGQGVDERVNFAGFLPLDETLRELAQARALLHPARTAPDGNAEATPQVVLWAQALKVPVVAGRSGSVPDIVSDGVTGRLLSSHDPKAFASAAAALCREGEERGQVVAEAFAQAMTKHSLPTVLGRWRTIYRAVAADRKPIAPATELAGARGPRFRAAFEAGRNELGPDATQTLLESGGQGVIYATTSRRYGRAVLKVANYRSEHDEDAQLTESRLRKEAEALAELARRGCSVVPRLQHLDAHGRFLIREYVDGLTLQDVVLGCSPEERLRLLQTLWQTARILFAACHDGERGHAICDLKPKNLVVDATTELRMVLVDVGSAKPIRNHQPSARSLAKVRLGTRNWLYWAPEVLLNHGAGVTAASDYFAFAATAFYTILRRTPYTNSEADRNRVIGAYQREYLSVRAAWETHPQVRCLPTEMADFVIRALHPLPHERPARIVS